jgi:hypothetical protein
VKWLTENWDKVLAGVLSTIVGGLIGFFSAISTLDKEIADLRIEYNKDIEELKAKEVSDLKTEVSLLKERLDQTVNPKLKIVDLMGEKIGTFEGRLLVIESQSVFLRTQSEIILRAQIGGKR